MSGKKINTAIWVKTYCLPPELSLELKLVHCCYESLLLRGLCGVDFLAINMPQQYES